MKTISLTLLAISLLAASAAAAEITIDMVFVGKVYR